jgi:alpha-L-rhamnosidase
MQDMRDAQGAEGELPPFAPNINLGPNPMLRADGGPAWADAGVIVPWTLYLAYGDRRILRDNYALMKRFVDFWIKTARDGIRCYHDYDGWKGFGDWLALDGSGKTDGGTPKDLIGTAFLAYSARLFSTVARTLGIASDAKKYEAVFEKTRRVFQKRFVTPDGLIAPMTQTAGVLALHFDLLPAALRPAVLAWLVRDIRARGDRLATGFVGSSYLPHVLSDNGAHEVAETLLFQKKWPSYLYAVTEGATTIWERWDGWTHDKGFQDAGMNSFNHYAYGAIGEWLYQRVAGLDTDPAQPGYKRLRLKPMPLMQLRFAYAALETPYGRAESGWERRGQKLVYRCVVPPNASAEVHLPGQDKPEQIQAGVHEWRLDDAQQPG